jgi:hypothetical protein
METITKIKDKYKEYKDSEKFIDALISIQDKTKLNTFQIRRFINYHFSNNVYLYRNCDLKTLQTTFEIQLRNSQKYVNSYDYELYLTSIKNASKYKLVLMEYNLLNL